MLDRRRLLKRVAAGAAAAGSGTLESVLSGFAEAAGASAARLPEALPAGLRQEAILDALPGKRPLLKLSYRPPNQETPVKYFDSLFTANDAFFVRYHLAAIPTINAQDWKLHVGGGAAATPIEFSLDQLKRDFEPVEIAAVCQCSGNRRGLFQPHVPGVQWGYGAMGNARWRGARLKDILGRVGREAADPPTVELWRLHLRDRILVGRL